ncbi:hypothetical protein AVEN_40767-1 [Araneus ventricosus]|uniref:Uncharacterized protein n=1 Tax=Araneus ventricosus TaxID=182803 RepID=A0A4Y2U7T8_ARAVE|nr:hypothetical protein AVEN_40767-1 [Araneus ventricosus]
MKNSALTLAYNGLRLLQDRRKGRKPMSVANSKVMQSLGLLAHSDASFTPNDYADPDPQKERMYLMTETNPLKGANPRNRI